MSVVRSEWREVGIHTVGYVAAIVAFVLCCQALAAPVAGTVHVAAPSGQQLSMTMKIDEAKTTLSLTGPSYSWFSFGFDTTTMEGYSLIVEGLNDARTVVEQNLLGSGTPGSPQAIQNVSILGTSYDAAQNLTTIVLERANQTGDPNDPSFSTSMTSLDVIWAYRGSATPALPSPTLNYHGRNGRGDVSLTFSPAPEPATVVSLALAAIGWLIQPRQWRRRARA
jgi:hypothetical protein